MKKIGILIELFFYVLTNPARFVCAINCSKRFVRFTPLWRNPEDPSSPKSNGTISRIFVQNQCPEIFYS